jgi:hypothetical protein
MATLMTRALHLPCAVYRYKELTSKEGSGGRGRDRTYDQSIKSRMLYQLSYASVVVRSSRERRVFQV